MIQPIQPNLFIQRAAPPVFNEGAASTASKVVAFIAAALASLVSFALLPVEAAVATSAGAAALLSMLCCVPNDPQVRDDEPRRWYHPVVDAFRVFVPLRGVAVGGVAHPQVAPMVIAQPQPIGHQVGPRVPVAHGHRAPAGGVAVMPQAWAQAQPVAHPAVYHAPAPAVHPHRVPLGHRA